MIGDIDSKEISKRVLIVDDMEIERNLLMRMFVGWDFVPHMASSVDEGLTILENFPPDYFGFAVIDVNVDGTLGTVIAKYLHNRPELQHIVTIACSSLGKDFQGHNYFDAVHTKPVRKDEILRDIHRFRRGRLQSTVRRTSVASVASSSCSTPDVNGWKILIVDDDAPTREVLKDQILHLGYDRSAVQTTHSCSEALKILSRNPSAFQCILMDILLPGMSGTECMRIIKQSPDVYGVPRIIALSADALDRTKLSALSAGAITFVQKPVSMSRLGEILLNYGNTKSLLETRGGGSRVSKKKRRRDSGNKNSS